MLAGVARSLRAIGFGRLLLVNGHGGNVDPLSVAVRELAVEYGFPIVATTPWFIAAKQVAELMETAKGPQHACEAETSVMLAMVPDLVRTDKLEEAMRQAPPSVDARAGYSRFWSFSERAPVTGVRGDPRPATGGEGRGKCSTRRGRGAGRGDERQGAVAHAGSRVDGGAWAGEYGGVGARVRVSKRGALPSPREAMRRRQVPAQWLPSPWTLAPVALPDPQATVACADATVYKHQPWGSYDNSAKTPIAGRRIVAGARAARIGRHDRDGPEQRQFRGQ